MPDETMTDPPPLTPWACDICGKSFRNYDLAHQHAEWDHPKMRFEDTKAALRELPATYEPPSGWAEPTVERKTNGSAIAALVLGLLSLIGIVILAPGALFFGHRALREIKSSNETQLGRGMAITGLVLGYLVVGLVVVALAVFGSG